MNVLIDISLENIYNVSAHGRLEIKKEMTYKMIPKFFYDLCPLYKNNTKSEKNREEQRKKK